jgi:predicted CoA-binding protein
MRSDEASEHTGDDVREILERCHTIAVIGVKAGASDDAFRVPKYMQEHGYRIVPVSPKLESVLGERCVASLREIAEPIDLVNLFRAPQHLPAHVDEILAMEPRPFAAWFQLGIRDDESAARLRDAGVRVVQDACLMVEHARLHGRGHP